MNLYALKPLPIILLTAFVSLTCWTTSAQQDSNDAVIDAYISRQAERERGEEYREARKVVQGDLTHDGVPEIVVLYTIEGQGGSNLYIQYLAVFGRRDGKLSPLTHAEVGGKFGRSIDLKSIDKNSILLNTLNYGRKDPECCPSMKGATKYVFVGRTLREQKQKPAKRR